MDALGSANSGASVTARPFDVPPDGFRQVQDLYDLFIEDARDYGLFLMDPDGRITDWSASANRLLGYEGAEIRNRPVSLIFTVDDQISGMPDSALKSVVMSGRAETRQWMVRKDGTLFWGDCIMRGLYDESRGLRGIGMLMHDTTHRKLSEEREALFYAISHVLVSTTSPAGIYPGILRTIGEGLRWDLGALWRVDRRRTVLCCEALWSAVGASVRGFDDITRATTFAPGIGLPGRVWERGEPVWLPDVVRDYNFPRIHAAAEAGLHAGFAFPICSETAVLGVIEFFSRDIRPPDEVLLRTVATLGYQIGLFLEMTEIEEAARQSDALMNHVGQILRGALEFHAMEMEIAAVLGEELHADRCFFCRRDFSKNAIVIDSDWRRATWESLAGEYPLTISPADIEARSRFDLVQQVDEARPDNFLAEIGSLLDRLQLRSALTVPAFEEGVTTGALVVASASLPRTWSPDELLLAQNVARQSFLALKTARLFKREHNIASSLQEALMPAIPQELPGLDLAHYYKAALEEAWIGGDFTDAYPLQDGCSAILIGDVSGKGLAAASQVATVRNMARCLLIVQPTVADATLQLNNIVTRNALLAGFATLFIGVFNTLERTLTYVSCGHEPGVLRHADGSIQELMPTGMVLGIEDGTPYHSETVHLSPGDTVFLYTDGITEAGPDHLHCLELSGLEHIIEETGPESAQSFVTRVVSRVAQHAQFGFDDDACALAAIVKADA
jgi:PAS domain S-box-containing protein